MCFLHILVTFDPLSNCFFVYWQFFLVYNWFLKRIIRCGGPVDADMANFIVAQLLYLDAVDPNKVCFLVFPFVKFVFAYYVIIFVALNSSPFIVRQLWVLFFAFGSFCFIFCVISFFFFYKVLTHFKLMKKRRQYLWISTVFQTSLQPKCYLQWPLLKISLKLNCVMSSLIFVLSLYIGLVAILQLANDCES